MTLEELLTKLNKRNLFEIKDYKIILDINDVKQEANEIVINDSEQTITINP